MGEVMEREFPTVKLGHQLIDSAAMLMVKNPRALNGIIVTSNLFGDVISDEASVIPGSLGLLPSASLTGIPDGKNRVNGIYEPIHGGFFSSFSNLPKERSQEKKKKKKENEPLHFSFIDQLLLSSFASSVPSHFFQIN